MEPLEGKKPENVTEENSNKTIHHKHGVKKGCKPSFDLDQDDSSAKIHQQKIHSLIT